MDSQRHLTIDVGDILKAVLVFTAAIAWNTSVKNVIDKYSTKHNQTIGILYALLLTIFVIIFLATYNNYVNKQVQKTPGKQVDIRITDHTGSHSKSFTL